MRSIKLVLLFLALLLVLSACAGASPSPLAPNGVQPIPLPPVGSESRTGAEPVTVVWRHSFRRDRDYFDHVLVNHSEGIVLGYWEYRGQSALFRRVTLDGETGVGRLTAVMEPTQPAMGSRSAILYQQAGEIWLDNEYGTIQLPPLPQPDGWLDILPFEQGAVLLGYQLSGRFVTRLDGQGETVWNYYPTKRGPQDTYVYETFGSRERLVQLNDELLGIHGLSLRGITALDIATGQAVWEYHIPQEDRICDVAISDDGIWVAGLSSDKAGVVALLASDGTVLREVEHPAPVTAVGPLPDQACWFLAGWGPEGGNKLYLLEQDRLAREELTDVEFGSVPLDGAAFVFINGIQGLLYRWLPGQATQAYELPFYGMPNQTQVLGARDGRIIVQHQHEVYALAYPSSED